METLYRKYRSRTFAELIGQKQATQILRNAIRRGRLAHAYLFCGPRGTGKTSVARIFAKALCCLNPQDGDCCGECAHCLQIAGGQALDVQEIDAASKNKVDDIRELRDRVGYAPAQFPYKIYIIDEVHMVTPQGFNALLKTLEEPPPHVKFLLCTTEAHKLPVTILSRCIRLDFTRIAFPELAAHLQWIATQEGFLDEDAALELAGLAEGSARDAISLLDQLTVYCENTIARADVRELFQLGDPELVPGVVSAIAGQRQRELLDTWERLAGQGADAGRFLLQVADALKNRYIESGDDSWRRALEAVWQGLNLLKQESFPALLVELTMLQASAAFAAPAAAAVHAAGQPVEADRVLSGGQSATGGSAAPGRKPEFLRRDRQRESPPPQQVAPAVPPAQREAPAPQSEAPPSQPDPVRQAAAAAVEPDEIGNPGLSDPQFVAYLDALKPVSLTAYALASSFASGVLADGVLSLEFDPGMRLGRAAMYSAQYPEHLSAYADAAKTACGAAKVRVGLRGDDFSWKASGSPFDDPPHAGGHEPQTGKPARETSGDAAQALFSRKAGKAETDPLAETEPEIDEAQVLGDVLEPQPVPQDLRGSADQLGDQINKAAGRPVANPATVEDVIELFGATLLDD